MKTGIGFGDEAEEFIGPIKVARKDATHNSYRNRRRRCVQIQWASDDGEPRGNSRSACGADDGERRDHENAAVVITRYFGGIKLGTGRPCKSIYQPSAKSALKLRKYVLWEKILKMKVKSDYTYLQRFQSLSSDDGLGEVDERLSDTGFNMGSIEYADKVTMDLLIRPENEKNVRKTNR